jgi:biofilm PGA synthesis protein PgaA
VARSLRNLHRWDEALALYRNGQRRFPEMRTFTTGEILTLADSGKAKEGLAGAEQLLHGGEASIDVLFASGYAARRSGDLVDALRFFDSILARDSANRDAQRERIFTIEQMGAPHEALVLAQRDPSLVTPDDMRRLLGSDAAQLVRFGPTEAATQAERYALTDRAIERLEGLIVQWRQDGAAAHDALLRARFDRLVAWRDRVRMSDVIREYEALKAENVEVPDYALAAVADAYLYLRRPDTALPLYRQVVQRQPQDFDAAMGMFYALIDTERFDEAIKHIDALNQAQPIWIWLKGEVEPLPNPKRETTEAAVAEARVYADAFPEAQHRFNALLDAAPNNEEFQGGIADTYAARGWPRRAAKEYDIALAMNPQWTNEKIAANTAINDLTLQDYRAATQRANDLVQRFPESSDVHRASRELDLYNRPELVIASLDRAYVPSTTERGGNGITFDATVYSPPIAYDWRLYAGEMLAHEHEPDGIITLRHITAGIEYRHAGLTIKVDPSHNSYGETRDGADLDIDWALNDLWSFSAGASAFAPDTPLRALLAGITADSGHVGATWRQNESRSLAFNAEFMNFSDHNFSYGTSLRYLERVLTMPHLKIDGRIDLAESQNSSPGQIYYSPAQDFEATAGVEISHILYRRYELYYEQQLTLLAGSYIQQDFGGHPTETAEYRFTVHASDALEGSLGVGFNSTAYDGSYENGFDLLFDLDWKF